MKKISVERNVQMLVFLLKAHGIKKIIVSPGSANCNFVCTIQSDSFFEIYSAVDERAAAYIACGMAFESREPIVITCTGATASRNYLPGLTEAYYRKLPVLAITASQDIVNAGHLSPQFIDRSEHPVDSVKLSVHLQNIKSELDAWDCNIKINRALLELTHNGEGPVHINLSTTNVNDYIAELPETRVIKRVTTDNREFPKIPQSERIAIVIGGHKKWNLTSEKAIERFCEKYNAVVFCDHSSQYHGKYRINPSVIAAQENYKSDIFNVRLIIHIGEQHGDYYANGMYKPKEVWRVSEDGEIRDTFKTLTYVFEMKEEVFFSKYEQEMKESVNLSFYEECLAEKRKVCLELPEIPFSNVWIASVMAKRIPQNASVQLGVSNTQRAWTFFDFDERVTTIANVGCRGIDGTIATALGMSLVYPEILHFCILGDLSFFYDMNTLGNRHVGNNLRILMINNGIGAEFKIYHNRANLIMGEDTNSYVAAEGHFGNKSRDLVKHFSEDLGFKYLCADNKDTFNMSMEQFLSTDVNQSIVLEVFTEASDESEAIKKMRNLYVDQLLVSKQKAKVVVKSVLGNKGTEIIKKVIRK